jgi:hypothetical protein
LTVCAINEYYAKTLYFTNSLKSSPVVNDFCLDLILEKKSFSEISRVWGHSIKSNYYIINFHLLIEHSLKEDFYDN